MANVIGVQAGRICPQCGREDSVPLVYGLPSAELFEAAERGLVGLGGCMVLPGGDPEFRCRSCGAEWGRESDPTADEQALADLLGVSYREVVRALGTGWRREELASGEDVHWFVSGEPAQVAIGVSGPTFVLARPLTERGEVRRDVLPPDDGRFSRDDLVWVPEVVADAVEAIASRRRRSFRWCCVCRRSHAPETFLAGTGICQQCDTMLGDWDRLAEPRADS
jgi:hypothetical protein